MLTLGFVWLGFGVTVIGVAAHSSATQVVGLLIAVLALSVFSAHHTVFSRRWHLFRRAVGGRR
jgi:hypothetical protein